ncbi:MAG: glycosyltransferase family 4 protein [Candidatus Symbiothrix sp.]|jgi:glycosyltransferase involved in cell wall biosynthesis|nr:glycosyltransferase family 4 protein [Candidatus Symbiothrix sp.]
MRLLFFASDYRIGLSALLTQQAIALEKGNLNPVCLAGEKEQEPGLTEKMKENKVPLIRIKGLDEHAGFKKLSNEIGTTIQKNQIQQVHVQNNWQLLLVAFYKYKNIIPKPFQIIHTLHGFRHNDPVKSIIATMVIGLILFLFANKIIVMSDYVKKRFFFLFYKIKKLYLGIDDTYFEKEKNKIETNRLKLVFPAQFREGKNQNVLIEAVASYIRQTQDQHIELHLPGEGALLNQCKKLAQEKGIESNVFFPGQRTKLQIKDLYEQCNIGIISSNSETFGQSIVEPYVLGRCILSRKVGVAPDIIKEGINGYFFDNEKDLVEKLIFLSTNKELIKEIGDTNFSHRETFSWETITALYKKTIL